MGPLAPPFPPPKLFLNLNLSTTKINNWAAPRTTLSGDTFEESEVHQAVGMSISNNFNSPVSTAGRGCNQTPNILEV